jgi:hypothetical protein
MSVTQDPLLQVWPLAQLPQLPPQPSEPHCLPVHAEVQHLPATQLPDAQAQSEQLLQSSPSAALQLPSPQVVDVTQEPLVQIWPGGQVPQVDEQPSSPQVLLLHVGVQQAPPMQLPPVHAQSSAQLSQVSPVSQLPLPH